MNTNTNKRCNQDKLRSRAKYIFPMFIWLKDRSERGEIDIEALQRLVDKNMKEHGRECFKIAEDWREQIDEVIKLSGFYLFDFKKILEGYKAPEEKKVARSETPQRDGAAKRKVVVIRRKTKK